MKKIIFMLLLVAGFSLTSCEKEKIGGTATQEMSGEWYVTVDANSFWFEQNYYAYQSYKNYPTYVRYTGAMEDILDVLSAVPADSLNYYCAEIFELPDTTNFDFDESGVIDAVDFNLGLMQYFVGIEEDDYDLDGNGVIDFDDSQRALFSVISELDYDYYDWDEDGEMTINDWIAAYLWGNFGQYYVAYEPLGLKLDMDGDSIITTADAEYFIAFLYDSDELYSPDTNGDGKVDMTDLLSDEYEELWYDVYDAGHVLIYTSNTAANIATEMLISDPIMGSSFKVVADPVAKTFKADNVLSSDGKYHVTLLDGKILPQAGTTPSGMPADSIIYYVKVEDDYAEDLYYRIAGIRRTGFDADEY